MESSLPSPQIHGISVTRFPKTGNTRLKALTFVTVTRSRYSPLRPMNVFLSWNMTLPKIQIIDNLLSPQLAKLSPFVGMMRLILNLCLWKTLLIYFAMDLQTMDHIGTTF